MKYDSDDSLDRALFALPLEEPPADLRAAILTATVYRPAPLFKPWEIGMLGAITAIASWLLVIIALGGGQLFVHSLEAIGSNLEEAFSNYSTLAWIAAGGGAAIWLSIFTGFQPGAKGVNARNR